MTRPRARRPVPRSARALAALAALSLAACGPRGEAGGGGDRDYLYVWTASQDSTQPDFLAVLDVTAEGERYGSLVTTIAVPDLENVPHHTEHELAADRQLFANGFGSGRTYIFDLSTPDAPRIAGAFGDVEGYSHPHSFLRLPNGNVLATFQMRHGAGGAMRTGGLVELTPAGATVKAASADTPGADPQLRVYSGAIVPALDRIVTTTTDMEGDTEASRTLQFWRLSDYTLSGSVVLPGEEGKLTAEPRLLGDGRTVLVSTFNCGLFLLDGIESARPTAKLVASFPRKPDTYCAIPVIAGHYYVVTVPALNAVVSLDIADPSAPREAGRVTLDSAAVPHWLSLAPDGRRLVLTGYGSIRNRAFLLTLDPATGALALDERFREEGATTAGFSFDDKAWPHGSNAKGVPHGAVFSRR